jgi:hypothetical protein
MARVPSTFPIPEVYASEAADIERDESKRQSSPPSFFFARSWGVVLAANYFTDERLKGRGGVAAKHRHRIQYAAFGQLMAAFEWCVKDFVAQIIDATDLLDQKIEAAKWIQLEKTRVLASREASASAGAVLIHPTQGWHDPAHLNGRYTELFEHAPLPSTEVETLERLWLLRHSVAHNAGFVTNHDAYRMRAPTLSEKSVKIDGAFLEETWSFLGAVVKRLADPIGSKVVSQWCTEKSIGDFEQDKLVYGKLKHIATAVESRSKALPVITEQDYYADRGH